MAIESSCDDTSAAVIVDGKVVSNVTAQQIVHAEYGGVVPELASRKHQKNILPVVDKALFEAQIKKQDLDAIAFTRGPGLLGSLIVGVTFAKAMAIALDIPIIEVHHMHAHILAHFIEPPYPKLPFLCLTVSGGHTQIVKVNSPLDMRVLGTTIDDAAGEAFDKTGKMLGLPYPAGPIIDKYAQKGQPIFDFPEPQVPGLDFSFSGLKTSILYFIRDEMKKNDAFLENEINNICASVQHRIVSILLSKLEKAAIQEKIDHIAIAGGVSANSALRSSLTDMCERNNWKSFIPSFQYCTDNAGMIAIAASFKYQIKEFVDQDISPAPRLAF